MCECVYTLFSHQYVTRGRYRAGVDLHFQFILYFNEFLTARSRERHIELTQRKRKYHRE